MSRSERRAAARKVKGGAPPGIARRHPDIIDHVLLDHAVQAGERVELEKKLRSKQVPGH